MRVLSLPSPVATAARSCLALAVSAIALGIVIPASKAQDAGKIITAMSDYVLGIQNLSASFDTDIEVVTSDLQKIQFASSGQLILRRPDKIRVNRSGGYTDIELTSDGKAVTVLGKHLNAFAQTDLGGTIDQVIDGIRDKYNIEMPGADLILGRLHDPSGEAGDARYIGHGVVDGVDCEHLAVREAEFDWQLWVEVGSRPIPRKLVITSKHVTGAPQYTMRIKQWKTDAEISPDAFAFKAPSDAKKVEIGALRDIDEIPLGIVRGAKK